MRTKRPDADGSASALAAAWGALRDGEAQLWDVRRVRVTPSAEIGKPELAQFERSCAALPQRVYHDGSVGPDLAASYRWRELLIHPRDWAELLREVGGDAIELNPITLWGVPVDDSP